MSLLFFLSVAKQIRQSTYSYMLHNDEIKLTTLWTMRKKMFIYKRLTTAAKQNPTIESTVEKRNEHFI